MTDADGSSALNGGASVRDEIGEVELGGGVDVIDKEVDTEYGDEGLCENVSEVDGG